jgi:hypothetical protein
VKCLKPTCCYPSCSCGIQLPSLRRPATLGPIPRRTVYSASRGGELAALLRAFDPEIRLVNQDGSPAEAYYRIESDGEGVIVVKALLAPQIADPKTNSGAFNG